MVRIKIPEHIRSRMSDAPPLTLIPLRSKESKCARFDTFPCWRVGRAGRIIKRGVRGKPCASIIHRIVAFEEQRFIGLHGRKIEPTVTRIERDRIDLSLTVTV